MINTYLLERRIKSSGKNKQYLADRCGLSYRVFNNCVNGSIEFKSEHIKILCNELDIVLLKDKYDIFFAATVP